MKPTTALPTARGDTDTDGSRLSRPTLCWALAGFGLGAVSGTAYLLLGGEYFFDIPRWAAVVFYPGFLAGFTVNGWGLSEPASKVVGVLAVGLAYAVLALLVRFALSTARKRTAKGPSDRAISPSSRSGMLALLTLFVAVSARAESPFVPDHVWVLGIDSHHPVGVAWDNPVWAGVHSSIQLYLCFGRQHAFEMELPVIVLGPLMLGVLVALTFALARPFKHQNPENCR